MRLLFFGLIHFKVRMHYVQTLSLVGGDKRDRTVDPLLAKQVLSQLSYTPIVFKPMKIKNSKVLDL